MSENDTLRLAQKQSALARRAASKRFFHEQFWETRWVVSWIAFQDSSLLCEIGSPSDIKARKRYPTLGRRMRVVDPDKRLLQALQGGTIRALRDGSELAVHGRRGSIGQTPELLFGAKTYCAVGAPLATSRIILCGHPSRPSKNSFGGLLRRSAKKAGPSVRVA